MGFNAKAQSWNLKAGTFNIQRPTFNIERQRGAGRTRGKREFNAKSPGGKGATVKPESGDLKLET
jgi:hypothetical protein